MCIRDRFLAVGLPLTRFGAEKNDFIKYLTKNKRVSFKYENESYHIEIDDEAEFPQCYAAVVDKIPAMAKKTLIVDIGSWTIDITELQIFDFHFVLLDFIHQRFFTLPFGFERFFKFL